MIDQLTRHDFTGIEGLAIDHRGQALPVRVMRLRVLPDASPRGEAFSVLLAGPPAPVLAQGIHALLHPRLGRLELFLVPVARDAGSTTYELIFN